MLNLTSTIMCPHGGAAALITGNNRVKADGAAVVLESDVHAVTGCPFMVGSKSSPCVRIEWSHGARHGSVDGTPVLVQSSGGRCLNAEGAVQGTAIVVNCQTRASAR
jgi:hypothetical protein